MKKEEKNKEKGFEEKILAYALKNAIEHDGQALAGKVLSALFHEGLEKTRVKEVMPLIQKTLKEVNSLSIEEQKEKIESLEGEISHRPEREGLPELPNAVKGKVVMRIAPFPSGPLHIGNTRQLILNDEYAKIYGGKLHLVIDDTIGSEEKQIIPEAYDMIKEGAEWLDVEYELPILYKSDRLEIYYNYADQLIRKKKAYVCFCDSKTLHENRMNGIECKHRDQDIIKNLEEWNNMLDSDYKEGGAVLRLKTDMKYKDPAFRDRVLFRISDRKHPRAGKKYRVWPLLELSWAIDDYLLGMTHVIRGKELMIETEMEKYIFDIFGWKYPEFIHTGLLQFEGVKLSKSKGQKEIREGRYTGWDDPRTWSLQSLEKRGIHPEVIRKFIIDLGINQNEITVPINVLYAENRKLISDSRRADFEQNAKGKLKIIMPDSSVVKGSSEINAKDKEMIHFVGFGFCKYNQKSKAFYFAHK
jgi:glutamyl-tRNA synthetase